MTRDDNASERTDRIDDASTATDRTAPDRAGRPHDIVVFGATGFVGELVAKHLAAHAPAGTSIALAGRDRAKLSAVRDGLAGAPAGDGARATTAADWPLIVADASSESDMRELAESTRVVLTLVGPYASYGRKLAHACAAAGTDYVDLTGEVLFAHDSIAANHELAKSTGARIVHSCGFDSIPSDIGVKVLHDAAAAAGDGNLGETTLVVTHMRGGVSGGTIDSMRRQLQELKENKELGRIVRSAYSLNPGMRGPGPSYQDDAPIVAREEVYAGESGAFAPFFMAPYNTRIVRRTAALLDADAGQRGVEGDPGTDGAGLGGANVNGANAGDSVGYGEGFRYREVMSVGRGLKSAARARAVKAGMGALIGGMMFGPTAKLLDKKLPAPGEGPSEESRARGRFTIDVHSVTLSGAQWTSRVELEKDPGYDGTAMMISAAALALAFDRDRLPNRYGVLTPASGIGDALVDRLREGGMKIEARKVK
ncbi:saccharopine dehydrogenase family protein [Corynebacterium hansenii]|uniref:Saccharopine dehydrogenase family protein n=1 Tax=Corynebacterium hansenii TaxID=394964 RepID=A0ABV7ZNV6_9CORY|nr:saccharopine dehydrogenase NADP-binding domain-containing protein [Corynebacterium hansenii]WJY98698.1 Putative trans-acting enoyl reductase [Corynebacterium hansenii]